MSEQPQIDARTAEAKIRAGAVLLDVREDDEWAAGHAPPARHVPLGRLGEHLHVLNASEYIMVCRSGNRSARAQDELVQGGRVALNLEGGMRAWRDAGLPVVRDDGSPGTVI